VSARPAIFVCGLGDPLYARLVAALAPEDDVDVIVSDPMLAAACTAEGVPHRTLNDLALPFPAAQIAGAQARAAELVWRADLDARSDAHFRTAAGTGFWSRIRGELMVELERAIGDGVRGAELARHLLRVCDLRLAIVGFDMTPWARGFVAALDAAGVPSLHVPHGLFARTNGIVLPGCSEIHASRVAVGGEFSRDVYAENGQPLERVVITGVPRWDLLPALRQTTPAAARATLGLDPARPLVVYATTWVELSRTNVRFHCMALAPIFRAILRGVRRTDGPPPQLVVKFHPTEVGAGNHAQVCEGYAALCRAEGAGEVRFVAGDRLPWLAAADLVVSVNSTIALEAVLGGRTALNVIANPNDRGTLYDDATAIPTVHGEEVEHAIGPLLRDAGLRCALAGRRPATIARYNHADDGGASARVAAEARRLVATAQPSGRIPAPAPLVSVLVPAGGHALRLPLPVDVPHEVLRPADADFTTACNRGAAAARGRFLAIVDDRLRHDPGWLDALLRAVQSSGETMILGGTPAPWVALRRADWERVHGFAPGTLARHPDGGLIVGGAEAAA